MKINLTNILLGALISLFIWQRFSSNKEGVEPEPVIITIPEKVGTTGTVSVTEVVTVIDTVYLPSKKQYIEVDKGWKNKYEEAVSEKEKLKLYYESIAIKKYDKVLIDNDTITMTGSFRTRGSLLDYKVDYTLHPITFPYTPDIIYRHPNLMIGIGVEAGIPTATTSDFALKGNLSFETSKGNNYNIGYDTDGRAWLGFTKTFKIY